MRMLRITLSLGFAASALLLAGCGGSTSSGGSTGGRVATSPGVSGTARGALIDVERSVRFAFADMEISTVGRVDQQRSDRWVVTGVKGTLNVTVTLQSQSPSTTIVEVRARTTEADYDNEFGMQLLNKITGG
ncbi:MAG: hypothetical protein O7E49_06305 [Gemmatimonadetes bacterium]|nr:hypothetical protein [Gemmatimonadota bacterium]